MRRLLDKFSSVITVTILVVVSLLGGAGPGRAAIASKWRLLGTVPTPPAARTGHASVYDVNTNTMIVYGGYVDGVLTGDISLLVVPSAGCEAGTPFEWENVTPGGQSPSLRDGPCAVFVPESEELVIFGGDKGGNEFLNDTWAWSLVTRQWRLIPTYEQPCPRAGAVAIYDPIVERMVMYGGRNSFGQLNDVWEFVLTSPPKWRQLWPVADACGQSCGPLCDEIYARDNAAAAYYPGNVALGRSLIVHGGHSDIKGTLNDVLAYDLDAPAPIWQALFKLGELGAPPSRQQHSAVYDESIERLVVFGGRDDDGAIHNDAFAVDLSDAFAWDSIAGGTFTGRQNHTAMFAAGAGKSLIYGGDDGLAAVGELWALDFDLTPPAAIGDLRNEGVTCDESGFMTAYLTWTAPGDNGDSGQACFYDIRWNLTPPTETNWESCAIAGAALAHQAGEPEWFVAGQSPEYIGFPIVYFAIRTYDDAGNLSPVSNVHRARCRIRGGFSGVAVEEDPQLEVLGSAHVGGDGARLALGIPSDAGGEQLEVAVFDVAGRLVRVLESGMAEPGRRELRWNLRSSAGARVASGVYYARMRVGRESLVRQVIVLH